jgi:hypothetical protein
LVRTREDVEHTLFVRFSAHPAAEQWEFHGLQVDEVVRQPRGLDTGAEQVRAVVNVLVTPAREQHLRKVQLGSTVAG